MQTPFACVIIALFDKQFACKHAVAAAILRDDQHARVILDRAGIARRIDLIVHIDQERAAAEIEHPMHNDIMQIVSLAVAVCLSGDRAVKAGLQIAAQTRYKAAGSGW